ncbi:hypothetical protein NXW50_00060 (plasmid) [Bacteroides thetaiotaomicron]|nr:hypothetical protein [Bacteroides thetaiotaomicron]
MPGFSSNTFPVLATTEVVVQPLERSFQLGYVPEKLPFLLGVPLPWATPKGQTPAVLRCAQLLGLPAPQVPAFQVPGTAECNLFVPS